MSRAAKNILILEDNDDDFFFVARALTKLAGQTLLRRARDGEEGVRYLAGEDEFGDRKLYPIPDLIICDVNMPRMDGFEFVSWMRADGRFEHIPLRILSSSREDRDAQRAAELRVESYMVKPGNPADWVVMVEQIVGERAVHAPSGLAP
jgi:CheY-like chemotaxis protein